MSGALRFLLDTGVVSAPVAKQPDVNLVRRIESHGLECAIAAPVWHELVFGCARAPRGKRRDALEAYIHEVVARSLPILPYDETAAGWHGRERARLEPLGRVPPLVDGQIAAIAVTRDLTLVTTNEKHFRDFADLAVVDWRRSRKRR